jgi:hypothetical protein
MQVLESVDPAQNETKAVNKKKGSKKTSEPRNDVESKPEVEKIMCPIKN